MSDVIQNIKFKGSGLNTDDDITDIPQGDGRNRLNVLSMENGDLGALTNMKGNTIFSPTGFTVLAMIDDIERDRIIVFRKNDTDNKCYIYADEEIIFTGDANLFGTDIKAKILGDFLIFTDTESEPKRIYIGSDLSSASKTASQGEGAVALNRPVHATLLKAYVTSENPTGYNLEEGSLYQFAVTYEYTTGEFTHLCQFSNAVVYEINTSPLSVLNGEDKDIIVRIGMDDEAAVAGDIYIVKKINLYVRKNNGIEWLLVDRWDPYDDSNWGDYITELTTTTYRRDFEFRFSDQNTFLESRTEGPLFSNVPITAKSIEIVDNKVLLANNTLGYDNPDVLDGLILNLVSQSWNSYANYPFSSYITLSVSTTTTTDDTLNVDFDLPDFLTPLLNPYDVGISVNIDVGFTTTVPNSGSPKVVINTDPDNLKYANIPYVPAYSGQAAIHDISEMVEQLTCDLQNINDKSLITVTRTTNGVKLYASGYTFSSPAVSTSTDPTYGLWWWYDANNKRTLKEQATYNFCTYFFDKYDRTPGALGTYQIYIPNAYMDLTNIGDGRNDNLKNICVWSINSSFTIPDWAYSCSFGISRALQIEDAWILSSYYATDNALKVDQSEGHVYTYQKGDFIRVWDNDYKIDEYKQLINNDPGGWVIVSDYDPTIYTDEGIYPLVQLIRPRYNQSGNTYFETSSRYIIDRTGTPVLKGEGGDNLGWFTMGDFDHNIYQTGDPTLLTSVSGRFIPELENTEQKVYQNILYSDRYFDNTQINGINSFQFESQESMDDTFGEINGILKMGQVLKVYQENKVTSIYLNKTEFYDASGRGAITAKSDTFLSSKVPSFENYGTQHPFSILKTKRYSYFYDSNNGVFVRDSANGMFPISGRYSTYDRDVDYKMDKFFKDLSEGIIQNQIRKDDLRVWTVFDELNDLIIIFFYTSEALPLNQVGFHEPSNRWISFYDMYTDSNYPTIGLCSKNRLLTALDDTVYIHNSDSVDRCNFYGEQKGWEVDVISPYAVVNDLQAISMYSTTPLNNDVYLPFNEKYLDTNLFTDNTLYSSVWTKTYTVVIPEAGNVKATFLMTNSHNIVFSVTISGDPTSTISYNINNEYTEFTFEVYEANTYDITFETSNAALIFDISNVSFDTSKLIKNSEILETDWNLVELRYKSNYFREMNGDRNSVLEKYNGNYLKDRVVINSLSASDASEKIQLEEVIVKSTESKS